MFRVFFVSLLFLHLIIPRTVNGRTTDCIQCLRENSLIVVATQVDIVSRVYNL